MSRELADRIASSLVAAWTDRVAHLEGSVVRSEDGVVVCLSNLPDDDQNVALVERQPRDPLRALEWAESRFEEHDRVLGVEIEHGRHPGVDGAVRALGLSVALARPAMALAVRDLPRSRPPRGVRIERAATPAELAAMVELDVRIFGDQQGVAEGLLAPSVLGADRIRYYLATLDGEPVAMAWTSVHDGSVGVFGVGTVPEHRREGIGTAVTAFAARDAEGADLAWLQPTSMGLPLYASMGFTDAAAWEVWVRRPSSGGR